jgi:hypothetical protein
LDLVKEIVSILLDKYGKRLEEHERSDRQETDAIIRDERTEEYKAYETHCYRTMILLLKSWPQSADFLRDVAQNAMESRIGVAIVCGIAAMRPDLIGCEVLWRLVQSLIDGMLQIASFFDRFFDIEMLSILLRCGRVPLTLVNAVIGAVEKLWSDENLKDDLCMLLLAVIGRCNEGIDSGVIVSLFNAVVGERRSKEWMVWPLDDVIEDFCRGCDWIWGLDVRGVDGDEVRRCFRVFEKMGSGEWSRGLLEETRKRCFGD